MLKKDKKIITLRVSEGLYNDMIDIIDLRGEFEDVSSYIRYCIRKENDNFYKSVPFDHRKKDSQ